MPEKTEKKERKPTYIPISEIPKKQANRVSKYYDIFAAIPEGEALRIDGKKELARYSGALRRLQKEGEFLDLKVWRRTINGDVVGFIGSQKAKQSTSLPKKWVK